jgi:hypothetical protein
LGVGVDGHWAQTVRGCAGKVCGYRVWIVLAVYVCFCRAAKRPISIV